MSNSRHILENFYLCMGNLQHCSLSRSSTSSNVDCSWRRRHSLLGWDWLYSLRVDWNVFIVKVNNLTALHSRSTKVFNEDFGQLKGFQAKLFVDPSTKPIFCKAHSVPYGIQLSKNNSISLLIIIEPVPFSDWAAPIVPVMKLDKTVRICSDFKLTVNKVSGGTSFTKLDLSQANQQLELDSNSKPYTRHHGLFKYNHLPYFLGISTNIGKFIEWNSTRHSSIEQYTHNQTEHYHNLQLVLNWLETAGLQLKKKCEFLVPSITYRCHRVDRCSE